MNLKLIQKLAVGASLLAIASYARAGGGNNNNQGQGNNSQNNSVVQQSRANSSSSQSFGSQSNVDRNGASSVSGAGSDSQNGGGTQRNPFNPSGNDNASSSRGERVEDRDSKGGRAKATLSTPTRRPPANQTAYSVPKSLKPGLPGITMSRVPFPKNLKSATIGI